MAEKLFLSATIDGQENKVTVIDSMKISQRIFAHHEFELSVPGRVFAVDSEVFDIAPDLIGKDILIEWEAAAFKSESTGDDSASFNGIITDVSISGDDFRHLTVVIRGSSPTILMDGVLNTDTYSDLKLKELYDSCNSNNLTSAMPTVDNLSFSDTLPFTVQYNETDFDFISRTLQSHGEWFYYDGKNICLGLEPHNELVITEQRCHSIDFSFNLMKPVPHLKGRDLLKHEVLDILADAPAPRDSMTANVSDEAFNLYPAHDKNYMPYPTTADGEEGHPKKEELKKRLDYLKMARANEGFGVHGVTDQPMIRVGQVVKIENRAYGGTYVITHVTHSSNGRDNYQNYFSARPVEAGVPSVVRAAVPRLNECVATVVDNADPEQMGRVKVQFDWGQAETPWLRMVMPHTGSNRGFYFVPEINEEVMVGFEMGKGEHPYVIGSLYNGENKFDARYDGDNKIKSIKTISGNEIIFNDHGSLTIHNAKNSMVLSCHEDGVIDIKTMGDLNLEAEKNMNITVGEEFVMTVGKSILMETEEGDFEVNATSDVNIASTKNMALKGGMDCTVTAGGNMSVEGTVDTKVKGLKTTVESSAQTDIKSSGFTNVKGSLVKIN